MNNKIITSLIPGDRWITGLELSKALNERLEVEDFVSMAENGEIDAYYDVAEDEFYLRLKARPKEQIAAIEQVSIRLPEEPLPKPVFEDELRTTGDDWRSMYEDLIKRGIIREFYSNGMTFVVASKLPGKPLQHGVHLE
ncbi:MAG: hypothetical protein ACP5NY_01215 [Thermocladium sp.]